MKRYQKIAGVLATVAIAHSSPVVFAETGKIEELGGRLTLFGAEQAGNEEGTIPPYTGGLPTDTAPDGWDPSSGRYEPSPFADEEPLFSVTSSNLEQYKDQLTEGAVALFERYPEFRMDIYPTRRSVAWSEGSLEHCISNAKNAELTSTGNGFTGAHACAPFPIPENGLELQWNIQTRRMAGDFGFEMLLGNTLVTSAGESVDVGHVITREMKPYHDLTIDEMPDNNLFKRRWDWVGPPTQTGTSIMTWMASDFDKEGQQSWTYNPGQRRVRVAPEFAFDTPVATYGGASMYDEVNGWDGSPERFDWKIVGKKEMYVPYNSNSINYASSEEATGKSKNVINPDLFRWELHRVWVLEATVKEGMRHSYPRRVLYVDEDSWFVLASDIYDQGGTLQRVGLFPLMALWDVKGVFGGHIYYDLTKGGYILGNVFNRPGDYIEVSNEPLDPRDYTPETLSRTGVR